MRTPWLSLWPGLRLDSAVVLRHCASRGPRAALGSEQAMPTALALEAVSKSVSAGSGDLGLDVSKVES